LSRRYLPLAAALLACGCSAPGLSWLPAEYDVYEAVVRHALRQRDQAPPGQRMVLYLALEDGDPPPAFLLRFAGSPVPVAPASHHQEDRPGVFAVRLWVGEVSWTGPDQARVMMRAERQDERLTCGTPWPCRLARAGGRWSVVVK
jgi:hypothetical protein